MSNHRLSLTDDTEGKTKLDRERDKPVPVDVQTFESPFGKARAVIFSDGTPWFVAKDAAEGLGLNVKGTSSHVRHLKDDQKQLLDRSLISNDIPRGLLLEIFGDFAPRVLLITRGGFNDMVMESRKPVAREYRQWVTDEVLPALQDTGTFTDQKLLL